VGAENEKKVWEKFKDGLVKEDRMTNKDRLNTMCPTVEDVSLGTKIDQLITLVNQLRTYVNTINDTIDGITAKLDADIGAGGASDTDYAAIWGVGGSDVGGNAAPADVSAPAVDTLD